MRGVIHKQRTRRGAIAVLAALLLIPMLVLVAFAIDLGKLALAKSELQAAADASAMAGATWIETDGNSVAKDIAAAAARTMAAANEAAGSSIALDAVSDVEFGFWNTQSRQFESPRGSGTVINAIRVRLRRDSTSGAPIRHAFAPVIGIDSSDLAVEAIAFIPQPVPSKRKAGRGTRFLVDDEMFDSDVASIENLASSMGVDPEWLISARDATSEDSVDWFVNLPAGARLWLPTGQVGDEGLLDIATNDGHPDLPQYPFTDPAEHVKFLKFNKSGGSDPVSQMRESLFTDEQLDPVHGTGRFNQPGLYPELVNPDFIHVSPLFKSDVSALNGVKESDENNGPDLNDDGQADGFTTNEACTKGVAAKDERRGLIAFRILDYKIVEPYPQLPYLEVEIVDPSEIDLEEITAVDSTFSSGAVFSSGGTHNVRLAQ
jgi:hypothetical protein